MTAPLTPRDEADLAEAVGGAFARSETLEVVGQGSRRALGRATRSDALLDVSVLSGITLYEPEELVLSARAGTPLSDIAAQLDAHGQMLAFEPADLGPLLGGPAGSGSLGGTVAVNLCGPRRLSAGAARDHMLGLRAVSGRGELFKAGGRVVKNVTGYDLPRLFTGAFGTLGVLTELTLKVMPKPPAEETLLVCGLGPGEPADAASRALTSAMGSSCEVSGAAFLPAAIAARLPDLEGVGDAVAFRMEGVGPSIAARRERLAGLMAAYGTLETLPEAPSRALWAALRDVQPFHDGKAAPRVVWRISTAPAGGPALAELLATTLDGEAFCDWAGGLIWLALPPGASRAVEVRRATARHGGHATLIRADEAERARVPVFQPLEGALAALTRRVKASFDPKGVLNRGRMHEGM